MNLAVFPLLLVALVMIAGNPDVENAQLALAGQHQVDTLDGALIVVEADVDVPAGSVIDGPIYVVGGTLTVDGVITGDLVQLAGTVDVGSTGRVGGQLQHTAGTLAIAPTADVARVTSLDLSGDPADGRRGVLPAAGLTLLLSLIGMLLTQKRTRALDTVAAAMTGHPVVALTVGVLLALTSLSMFVFMALTLVLLPVALVGLLVGVLTVGHGLVAWGHYLGSLLPIRRRRIATGVGVALAVAGIQLAASIPVLGDLLVGTVLLIGLGAVLITYYGASPFRPAVVSVDDRSPGLTR